MKRIQVELKSLYGREIIYPACPQADGFCQLIGQKSLTRHQVDLIKSLGYEVQVVTSHPATL